MVRNSIFYKLGDHLLNHRPLGHCIEQIRQYLIYYSGLGRDYVLSDTSHTCRNFEAIREWTWERYNGSTAVQPAFESTSHPAAGHGHEDENHHSAQKT